MQSHPKYQEKQLLLQVATGDETAFRQLFLQWHQLLAGYIFRITESNELTEEILQDVFLKIWMTRETLTEINNFKHFLLVVSRNRAFDMLKKQLKENEMRWAWEKENSLAAVQSEDRCQQDPLSSLIDQAIDSLPPRRKEVYLLSRHQRLSYKEVAARLGISRESVKTHLQLATSSIASFIRTHLAGITLLITSLLNIF